MASTRLGSILMALVVAALVLALGVTHADAVTFAGPTSSHPLALDAAGNTSRS